MMFRGSSKPRFEKRNFPPDLRAKCRLQPCVPHPPRVGVAPAGCVPEVSPSGHRAALSVRFPITLPASMMKFCAAVGKRVLDGMS